MATLHKARWGIEKVYDEFKNKFCETKAWASGATSKTQHARLLCLTHNLTTLMEEQIRKRSGVINEGEHSAGRKPSTPALPLNPNQTSQAQTSSNKPSSGSPSAP